MSAASFEQASGDRDPAGVSSVSPWDVVLDEMSELLREQARAWAVRLRLLLGVEALQARSGAGAGFAVLEMAGSWNVSQVTAARWLAEAVRFAEASPRTLALLGTGELLEHQAKVLLHRTAHCSVVVARAVEAQVLPAGVGLCPADLAVRVDRAVLRVESAQAERVEAQRRAARAAAQRRTFAKALPDAMGLDRPRFRGHSV